MEFCDLYDENRRPLGRVHDRSKPLAPGEYLLAVGVWVFNSKNEILLTRRSPEKKFAPNLWENTGGHVMAGERSAEATVRELFEETGIRARPDELRYIGSTKTPPYFGDEYVLRRDVDLSELTLQEGETSEAKWVTEEEFDRMILTGEVAPSVAAHLAPYRPAFNRVLHNTPAVVALTKPEHKRAIAADILYKLPHWFGVPESTAGYIEKSGNLPFLAYFDGEKAIGFLAIQQNCQQAAEICVMGVDPTFHRRGIGRALVEECLKWCREHEMRYLQVKTLDGSIPDTGYARTRAFYEAMGFCPLECFPSYWDEKNPCLLMVQKVE